MATRKNKGNVERMEVCKLLVYETTGIVSYVASIYAEQKTRDCHTINLWSVANIQKNFRRSKCKIHLGQVNYIDYEKESIYEPNDPISPFMHKRNYYEDEQEVRLLIEEKPDIINPLRRHDRIYPRIVSNRQDGVLVPIEVSNLIESVYVAPDSEDWFLKLVQKVTKKYHSKHQFQIQKSKMSGNPGY